MHTQAVQCASLRIRIITHVRCGQVHVKGACVCVCVNIKRCLCYFTIPIVVEGVCVGYSGVCFLIIIIVCVCVSLSLSHSLFLSFCLFTISLSLLFYVYYYV